MKGADAVDGDAVLPGGELAGLIEARPQMRGRRSDGTGRLHVVLARPHHLHRPARFLRQQHRVDDEIDVAVAAPAEAAAHQHVVQLHLVASGCRAAWPALRSPWSGFACQPRSRPHRPPATPTRRRSAAPSARDRRSRSGTRPPWWRRPSASRRARSPIRLQSVDIRAGFLASAANRSMPLSLSKPHAVPVRRPGHGLRERLACVERRPRRLGEHADAIRQAHDAA